MDSASWHQQNQQTFNSHQQHSSHHQHPHTNHQQHSSTPNLHSQNFSAHQHAMDLTHLHQQNGANFTPALCASTALCSAAMSNFISVLSKFYIVQEVDMIDTVNWTPEALQLLQQDLVLADELHKLSNAELADLLTHQVWANLIVSTPLCMLISEVIDRLHPEVWQGNDE